MIEFGSWCTKHFLITFSGSRLPPPPPFTASSLGGGSWEHKRGGRFKSRCKSPSAYLAKGAGFGGEKGRWELGYLPGA